MPLEPISIDDRAVPQTLKPLDRFDGCGGMDDPATQMNGLALEFAHSLNLVQECLQAVIVNFCKAEPYGTQVL